MIKKLTILCLAVGVLGGCTPKYTLQGQKYDSKEEFHRAVAAHTSSALASITPLPTPLTQRKLICGFPSESAILDESIRRFVATNSREPNALQKEMMENLTKANYKNSRVFLDAVAKKNIYRSTQYIDMESMTGSLAASADTDTLYYVEAAQGSGQWFYDSAKHGKQIFSADRSKPTIEGKVQAFVDAVQAQAIRD